MFAFVLVVELLTALGNNSVDVGGVLFGPSLLLLALLGDITALVAVSLSGSTQRRATRRDGTHSLVRTECALCQWTATGLTSEQAMYLGQQHLKEAHGGTAPTT